MEHTCCLTCTALRNKPYKFQQRQPPATQLLFEGSGEQPTPTGTGLSILLIVLLALLLKTTEFKFFHYCEQMYDWVISEIDHCMVIPNVRSSNFKPWGKLPAKLVNLFTMNITNSQEVRSSFHLRYFYRM